MTSFPPGFFSRLDPQPDDVFYAPLRLVTHIDDDAIDAVGDLYERLGLAGDVLDIMSSWVSHFRAAPRSLTVLGMNAAELARNDMADTTVVHDLNVDPRLPFGDDEFDAVTCCVSVDYLVRPVEVFVEVAASCGRGAASSSRSPTAASRRKPSVAGSPATTKVARRSCSATSSGRARSSVVDRALQPGEPRDPLYAVWASTKA